MYNIHQDNRVFLGIPNIHVIRESAHRLTKVIDAWQLIAPLNHRPIEESGSLDRYTPYSALE